MVKYFAFYLYLMRVCNGDKFCISYCMTTILVSHWFAISFLKRARDSGTPEVWVRAIALCGLPPLVAVPTGWEPGSLMEGSGGGSTGSSGAGCTGSGFTGP